MKPVFVDTGYLIALEAADDDHHAEAAAHWDGFRRKLPPLVTSSHVFTEIVTFFNSRGRHSKAVEVGQRLLQSSALRMVQVDAELLFAGWDLLTKQHDKTYSLTDCISFIIMSRMGLRFALTFDHHFRQAGFVLHPER